MVSVPGQRQGISAASAVSAKGAFWFATYAGGLNGKLFITLLRRMMRGRRRPLHLILDGLPAHKTKAVTQYVAGLNGTLTLHYLPGYAPCHVPHRCVQIEADTPAEQQGVLQRLHQEPLTTKAGAHLQPQRTQELFRSNRGPTWPGHSVCSMGTTTQSGRCAHIVPDGSQRVRRRNSLLGRESTEQPGWLGLLTTHRQPPGVRAR